MLNTTFEGISGTVHIDNNGARVFDFVLLDYWNLFQSFGAVRRIRAHQTDATGQYTVTGIAESTIVWPQGSVLGPDAQCETGCISEDHMGW